MKKLVIIGAGGFAREVAWLVEEINSSGKEWELLGFIDENLDNHSKVINGLSVLGGFNYFEPQEIKETIYAVCAVGSARNKSSLVKKAASYGIRFANLVHPSVIMSGHVSMGQGNIVCAGSIVTTNVIIGNHVAINPGCGIGHDVTINDYATILWGVNLSGNVVIGKGSEIGSKSVVIQGINIGEWSIIGAGTVVVRDIPSHCTAVGVPAKPIKFNSMEDK